MAQTDTVTRILDAAEDLFAEKGFTETSLRSITQKAKVNVAAVNYHFGSKKELIQAVFARFLNPFCSFLDKNLDDFEAELGGKQTDLESIFGVLEKTLSSSLKGENAQIKISIFLRLLGLAYTQSQGHMRRFLKTNYHTTYFRFIEVIHSTRPDISPPDLFWRIHFAVGSIIFTFSSIESLRAIAAKDHNTESTVSEVIQKLMPYIAGGINHP